MAALALTFALALAARPADAANYLPTQVVNGEFDPVEVIGCYGQTTDSQFTPNYYLGFSCRIDDHDTRTAAIVRLRFEIYDAFGVKLGQYVQDAEGKFSPETIIELKGNKVVENSPYFSSINTYPGARSVVVSLERVLFTDGSTYDSNDLRTVIFDQLDESKKADLKAQLCKQLNDASDIVDSLAPCNDAVSRIESFIASAKPITGEKNNKILGYEAPVLAMAGFANCKVGDKATGRNQLKKSLQLVQAVLSSTNDAELITRLSKLPSLVDPTLAKCNVTINGSASST